MLMAERDEASTTAATGGPPFARGSGDDGHNSSDGFGPTGGGDGDDGGGTSGRGAASCAIQSCSVLVR